MKNSYLISFVFSLGIFFNAFSQTSMTIELNNGQTVTYKLSEVDSIKHTVGAPDDKNLYYSVRDIGPAGGMVIYDKGYYSDNWRYIEISLRTIEYYFDDYGCYGTVLQSGLTDIGDGMANTVAIVSNCNEANTFARKCYNHSVNIDGVVYDDWYLPSIEELRQAYNNLTLFGIDFQPFSAASSSEFGGNSYLYFDFISGIGTWTGRYQEQPVHPIRYF